MTVELAMIRQPLIAIWPMRADIWEAAAIDTSVSTPYNPLALLPGEC